MAAVVTETHCLSPIVSIWHRYDQAMKAELSSTALNTKAGIFLVDPFPLDADSLADLTAGHKVAGIVVTNCNHHRAAKAYAAELSVPIHASEGASIPSASILEKGVLLAGELTVVPIEGAAAGEIALFGEREGGTLIMGDALINFGTHGFDFLPKKYCLSQKLMRKSLRKLLEFSFERILFAHGLPIVSGARSRLAALLETAA